MKIENIHNNYKITLDNGIIFRMSSVNDRFNKNEFNAFRVYHFTKIGSEYLNIDSSKILQISTSKYSDMNDNEIIKHLLKLKYITKEEYLQLLLMLK